MRISTKLNKHVLLTLAISLLSAGAQAGNFWKPEKGIDDYSVRILQFVFGPVVEKIYTNGTLISQDHILSTLLGTMNAGVLVIGMIIMAYTYIGGAVHTAKDGEWLGKKWDTMMVPLRTAAGMAMLLPTVAGYSFLQVVLIWTGLQAVGLGSNIWTAAYDKVANEAIITPPFIAPNKTAKQVFLMTACRQAGDMYGMAITEAPDTAKMTYAAAGSQDAGAAGFCGTIQWGASSFITKKLASVSSLIGCDTIFSPSDGCTKLLADTNAAPFSSFNMGGPDSVELFDSDSLKAFETDMRQAHGEIISDMLNGVNNYASPDRNLKLMAQDLLDTTDAAKVLMLPGRKHASTMANAQLQYEKDLIAKISEFTFKDLFKTKSAATIWKDAMAERMKEGGWIHAGSFYMKLGNLNNAVQRAINGSVSTAYTLPNIAGIQNETQNSAFSGFLNNLQQAVIGANELASKIESQTPNKLDLFDIRKTWNSVTDGMSTGMLKFAMVGEIGKNGMDPLVQLKSIGDTTIVAAEAMMIGGASVLSSGAKNDSGGKNSDGGTSTMSLILAAITAAMMGMGMFLGIILPMLPYVFWVSGVAWWLISFVEAVIAAPIWAIAHMHPEGHDVAGRGSPGYMFVLSILIRPALMVIFLFAAMVLIKPIMTFVNQGFFQSLSNMTEGSMVGVMTLIGTLILYSGITTKIIMTVFGVINTGPDNIMRWIGGSDSVGSQAQSTASNIHQGVDAAGGQAAGGVGKVASGIGNKIASRRGSVVSTAQ